jgi:hypothetical protein
LQFFSRHAGALSRAVAYFAAVAAVAPLLFHISQHSTAYLGLFEDDHFYYTKVADNFVKSGKLTYDGTTLTNGFHPLWFALIVLLRAACGSLGAGFYVALATVFLLSAIATYELGRCFALRLGASEPLSALVPAVYSLGTACLISTGMECAIAIPLLLWWLTEIARPQSMTLRRCAWLGWLASVAVLARLDIAIAVALAIAGYAICTRPGWLRLLRQLGAFGAGGALVPIYFAANQVCFGTWLPVSALAKHLLAPTQINVALLHGIYWYFRFVAVGSYLGPTAGVICALGLLALLQAARAAPRANPTGRFAGALTLAFTGVFFFVNSLSGWIFFGWYAYPLPAATIVALVFIFAAIPTRLQPLATAGAMLAAVLVIPGLSARYFLDHGPRWSTADNSLWAMSEELARRTHGSHGLYAMGAVAGMAATAMDQPVLQLEGIISDPRMVGHVARQDSLASVLREYAADFLIVSFVGKPPVYASGCVLVTQPEEQWAGKRTAKMRGWVCGAPLEHFFTAAEHHPWSRFSQVETFVWDVHRVSWLQDH